MLKPLVMALASAGLMFGLAACAEGGDATPAKKTEAAVTAVPVAGDLDGLKKTLESKLPGLKVSSIRVSEYPALVEVVADGDVLYASPDGKFVFNGAMFSLSNGIVNLSEQRLDEIAAEMAPQLVKDIEALGEASMIVFKAANEKHKVTVFTDVDCGYCRKLHSQIAKYNELGITVRYLAYPRGGIPSESYTKLQSVWCADDRKAAMTVAKQGGSPTAKSCKDPVEQHFGLARKFNLSGTPAIVMADGTLVAGYVPPEDLAANLDKKQASR